MQTPKDHQCRIAELGNGYPWRDPGALMGGYPSIINMDRWIPRFSSRETDYPLKPPCDLKILVGLPISAVQTDASFHSFNSLLVDRPYFPDKEKSQS